MKKHLLLGIVLSLIMFLAKPIAAQDHGFGIGLI